MENKDLGFWSHEAQNIRCVRESDYEALREELADAQRVLSFSGNEADANSTAALHTELEDAQQRLAAAEQRNAELVELLRETSDYLDGSTRNSVWCDSILHKKMKAAIQPTEWGAGECAAP